MINKYKSHYVADRKQVMISPWMDQTIYLNAQNKCELNMPNELPPCTTYLTHDMTATLSALVHEGWNDTTMHWLSNGFLHRMYILWKFMTHHWLMNILLFQAIHYAATCSYIYFLIFGSHCLLLVYCAWLFNDGLVYILNVMGKKLKKLSKENLHIFVCNCYSAFVHWGFLLPFEKV